MPTVHRRVRLETGNNVACKKQALHVWTLICLAVPEHLNVHQRNVGHWMA